MSARPPSPPEGDETITRLREQLAAHAEAAERVEARLRVALQVSRIGTWMRDVRTGVVEWSRELAELFGIDPDQSPRTTEAFFELVHPEDRAPFAAAAAEAI